MNWLNQFKNRKVVYGTGSIISVLLVLGILIVAAWLAEWYPLRWDLTRGQTQSLSAVSRNLLKQVDKPLTMTAFLPEGGGERTAARDVLQRYAYLNPKLSYQFVDPEREPLKAKEAGYRSSGNILLEYNGRHQMSDRAEEDSITNTLRKILQPERKKLYFLTGHGERDLDSAAQGSLQMAKRALENEGYEIAGLNLVSQAQVPQDAAVVIVASPKKAVLSNEADALKAYLNRGGRLLVLLEAQQDTGLQSFLAGYGITPDEGVILDPSSQSLRLSPVWALGLQYGPSRITQDFKGILTLYPMSRPLTLNREIKTVNLLPLVSSTPSSYEKTGKDWLKTGKAAFDAQTDKKGPFTIGALAEIKLEPPKPEKQPAPAPKKPEEENKAYLAVYGDVDFASNAAFNLVGNGDLFLNTVNFLAAEEQQIMVREASKAQLLVLSRSQIWLLFVVSLVFAPLVLLVAGIWAYRTRRARK